MIPSKMPTNAYTDSPLQHPNIFFGCLQLLFWLVFRPTAWKNHIQHLDPSLDQKFYLWQIFERQRWQHRLFWRFFVQVFVLLPTIASLVTGVVFFSFGVPLASSLVLMIIRSVIGIIIGVTIGMLFEVSLGVLVGVACGILLGSFTGLVFGVSFGLAIGLAVSVTEDTIVNMVFGVVVGVLIGVVFGVPASGTFGIAFVVGSWANWWRPIIMAILFIPWHALLYQIDARKARFSPSLLYKNLAFWDEWQYSHIEGLDKHLLLVIEKNPIEGQAALNYLSATRQSWAAQAVQIELDARQLERCLEVSAIGQISQILIRGELASPADTIFRQFNSISADVNAALGQNSIYNQRNALTAVNQKMENSILELTISSDKYAPRFRPIARLWQHTIYQHLQDLIREYELRQEIDSPYIIGVPVNNPQQLFVGRINISKRLEKLLLDRRSPPLLLYGQRRTGKTSLLNNLGRLLPTSIIPLFVDLQGISSAKDHNGFLYGLAKGMINSAQNQRNIKLPTLSYETLIADPFIRFNEWLDNLERALAGNTALLALDEFEVLDRVLSEGRFNENDVLGLLRNLIQHRPTFKVLLAGSHTLDEFQRWSSYLINAQVIHLGYLQEAEARQLIEEPIKHFTLRYQTTASQRVIDITRGHPFLVQLLCAEIIALKNEQDPNIRRLATLTDVESAIPAALEHGSLFFINIEHQLDTPALTVLRYLARQGEATITIKSELERLFLVGLERSIKLLMNYELIEVKATGYAIQIELIRRWFC
jgi:hypothetical protein